MEYVHNVYYLIFHKGKPLIWNSVAGTGGHYGKSSEVDIESQMSYNLGMCKSQCHGNRRK